MLILLCIVAIIALIIVRLFILDKMTIDMTDKAILVTGSNSGFGKAFVLKCLDNGITVFAGCRTPEGVKSLKEASSGCNDTLFAFEMDVTLDESVENAKTFVEQQLKQLNKNLHAIVNNAGGGCQYFYDDMLSLEDYKNAMAVNAYGVIRVTKAFKQIIKHNKGRIITCLSGCLRITVPTFGPYAFAKWAAKGYLEVLRHELTPFNVQVITIEPGTYQTNIMDVPRMMKMSNEIWAKADPTLKKEYGEYWFSAGKKLCAKIYSNAPKDIEPVADVYLHATIAKYPYRNYCVGRDMIMYQAFSYLSPRLQEIVLQMIQWMIDTPKPDILDS